MDVKIKIFSLIFGLAGGCGLGSGLALARPAGAGVPSVDELLAKAEATLKNTTDYRGKLIRKERIDGRMVKQYNYFKFARPFSVYLKFIDPFAGREVIYRRGWNEGRLRVHRGSFPDLTVNLDPRGSTAMKRSHHAITDFGLENTVKLMSRNLKRALSRGQVHVSVSDGGKLFGQPVWKIEAVFPALGDTTCARPDETLWNIADRSGQDMYWILVSNHDKNYDDPDDVDERDRVFIPDYYGARAEFSMSKATGLPIKIVTFDHQGRLYESYEYPQIELNVGLTDKDFDPQNEAYDF